MKELFDSVSVVKDQETERAKAKFGDKYNSLHEAYAVMLEEIYEARHEMEQVMEDSDRLFLYTRSNNVAVFRKQCQVIRYNALKLACEAIQIAAVCDKAIDTTKIEVMGEHNDDDSN